MGSAPLTLGLPSTVLVGRVMPKKAFYEHLLTTAAVKNEFTHLIERIEITAALKEASLHMPAGDHVAEIDVLGINLRAGREGSFEIPSVAMEYIARGVPNKVLFACKANNILKLLVFRGKLYQTEWSPAAHTALELRGATLDELWDSLCSQVVFGDSNPADFMKRVERKNQIEDLRRELAAIEKKRITERQIARKMLCSIANG